MSAAVEAMRGLSAPQQASLAVAIVELVAPYGAVDPTVVTPDRYQELLEQLRARAEGSVSNDDLSSECEAIIAKFAVDEPVDAGFYAFGAIVAVFYAFGALRGDPDGGVNTAKRFLDLTGSADDDGVDGLFQLAENFVITQSESSRTHLAARITEHAASLT